MNKLNLTDDQKRKLQEAALQADQHADNWLAKVAKSKWSWAIVVGIVAAAWLFGYVQ